MLKPFLVDLGYNIKEIGFMSGIVGTSAAALCALLGGFIIRLTGRKPSMYIFTLITLVAASYLWFISKGIPDKTEIYVAICLLWGSYGLSTVVIYTTSMDNVRKGMEGTDFTLQIVVTHLSSILVAVLSGRIGDKTGYNGLFGLEALLTLFTLVLLFYAAPKTKNYEHFS
jgi:predicted MFS family arabinose efflux permease